MSFRMYMLSIMTDQRGGYAAAAIKALLRVFSWFYSSGIRVVDLGYRSGIRRIHKAAVPVISIGNITLGGTGKTPLTILVADHLLSAGMKPAILTRGYGRDEDRLLSEELPDVPVYVGQDRVKSALKAVSDGCGVIVMDDGFQHRRLARDLDIVLVEKDPLLGGAHLFPRGVLREPLSSLGRAGMLVISRADALSGGEAAAVARALSSAAPGKPVAAAAHKASSVSDVTGASYPVGTLKGKKVLLVSGIASPGQFASMAADLGCDIVGRMDYGDHHAYSSGDVREIGKASAEKGADAVLVTKKDFVKLRGLGISSFEEKILVLNIRAEIVEGKEMFLAGLNSVLSGDSGQ